MHVMPDDDVFFITDVKIEDMGVYSCTAQNSAGSVLANATLTVLGKRHCGVPRNQVFWKWGLEGIAVGALQQLQIQKGGKEAVLCTSLVSFFYTVAN